MTSTPPPPGERLIDGRYRLSTLLGSGGVAEVYRAFDDRLHRDVAIKLFRTDVADQLRRHEDEMRTLARLDHPSLVTVLDAGEDDETGRPYLVMTLIEGPTLAEELRYGPLPTDRVAEIGTALADALAYVHSQGLVHRDIKPANVLISSDGRVHLADFGIARLVDASHVTTAGEVVGTPAYFAPEQVTGEPVGPPADVYALGLLLLECLTGRREYDGPPLEAAMARVSRPPAIPSGLPVAWRDLLSGMLARVPAGRLSAAHVADRLRRLSGAAADATVAIGVPIVPSETVAMARPTAVMPAVSETTDYVQPGSTATPVALVAWRGGPGRHRDRRRHRADTPQRKREQDGPARGLWLVTPRAGRAGGQRPDESVRSGLQGRDLEQGVQRVVAVPRAACHRRAGQGRHRARRGVVADERRGVDSGAGRQPHARARAADRQRADAVPQRRRVPTDASYADAVTVVDAVTVAHADTDADANPHADADANPDRDASHNTTGCHTHLDDDDRPLGPRGVVGEELAGVEDAGRVQAVLDGAQCRDADWSGPPRSTTADIAMSGPDGVVMAGGAAGRDDRRVRGGAWPPPTARARCPIERRPAR